MKVITTHIGADFDSLASMIAAAKLYPGAVPCFSGSASRNVRDYLKRYQSRYKVVTPRKVKMDEVTTLIVVDTRSASRIGPFAALVGKKDVTIHVYDHHPGDVLDELPASYSRVEVLGACTTLLVEVILERGIAISPHEATLFAMGIYEDSGALTFGSTCRKDYEIIATLRELGADMTQIPIFVEQSLTSAEKQLLNELIDNSWERYINGAKVVLSALNATRYVEGLSLFAHRLRDYFDADVAVCVVSMGQRTYIVARSKEEILNVSDFLAQWGGGGHPQAASVTLERTNPYILIKEVEDKLARDIKPLLTVASVMTSPVMAIDPDLQVDEAYKLMIRYGHSGLPIVQDGNLIGIITRKDLDKAHLHGFGSAKVREFMTEGVITVHPEASVSEAHRLMVFHNIGRLPVKENGLLVGIITRTDLLRALYPISVPPEERSLGSVLPWTEDVSELMAQRLSPWITQTLRRLGKRAEEMSLKAYVVGGFVRDLLLGKENQDLDIVIEGDAISFIKSWETDGCTVAVHERYRTGTIVFPGNKKVDVATARREFYEYPVALPKVVGDSLKHDLYRRDFTVNSMAISINETSWGTLIDYFGGRRDLQERQLRVLHNLSFVEDPTRVLRGLRLKHRLGFEFEDNTYRLIMSAVKGGLLGLLSGTRVKNELKLIFLEEKVYPIVLEMVRLGIFEALFPGIKIDRNCLRIVRRLSFFMRRLRYDLPHMEEKVWLAFLAAIIFSSVEWVQNATLDKLHLSKLDREIIEKALDDLGTAENAIGGRGMRSHDEIYLFLADVPYVTALFWAAATEQWRVRRRILLFLTRLHRVHPILMGRDLVELGYPKGPIIGKILDELLRARLRGEVETREDEIKWVKKRYPLYALKKG
ncbi:MAG: CBS domain-containing protein [Acetomicrobium sp.]